MGIAKVLESVRSVVGDHLGVMPGEMVEDANIRDDLGADELDECEIVMALEEMYSITIPDKDMDTIKTIGTLTNYIFQKVKKGDNA